MMAGPKTGFPARLKAMLVAWAGSPSEYPDGTALQKDAQQAVRWLDAHAPIELKHPQDVDPRTPADTMVNGGALQLAVNALRRMGRDEIADELMKTATKI